jgi:hypothetical protein
MTTGTLMQIKSPNDYRADLQLSTSYQIELDPNQCVGRVPLASLQRGNDDAGVFCINSIAEIPQIQRELCPRGCPMEERQTDSRRRPLKAGKITIEDKSVIDCRVRNFTRKGACLELERPINIPDAFELSISLDNFTRKCEVNWKQPQRIGVSFEKRGMKK